MKEKRGNLLARRERECDLFHESLICSRNSHPKKTPSMAAPAFVAAKSSNIFIDICFPIIDVYV